MKKLFLSLFAAFGICSAAMAGDGTKASPYTVDQLLSLGTPDSPKADTYVEGFIVGYVNPSGYTYHFTAEGCEVASNILMASGSAEDDYAYCIPVQLVGGSKIRTELNLQNNPQNIGHKIVICGSWEKYFDKGGIKAPTSYEWVGTAPTPGDNPGGGTSDPNTYLNNEESFKTFTVEYTVKPAEMPEIWTWYNSDCAKATAYYNNASYASDTYLVSPAIALGTATTATVDQTLNYLSGGVLDENIGIYVREGSGAWQQVKYSNPPAGSSWTFVTSEIDLSAYAGKTIQFGFRYRSTAEKATTWEFKNLKIGGTAQSTPENPTTTMTVTEALAWLNAGNKGAGTVQGYITSIKEVSTQYGNATYYIGDTASSTSTLTAYRGYYLNGDKFTSEDQIKVGDLVVVSGNLELYGNNKEPQILNSKIISINGEGGSGGETPNPNPNPNPGDLTGDNVTFNFTQPSTLDSSFSDEGEGGMELDLTGRSFTSSVVTIAFASADNASTKPRLYYGTGGAAGWTMRFYKDNTFTVSVADGYILKGIEFTGSNLTKDISVTNGAISGSGSNFTWTASGEITTASFSKTATGNNPTVKTMKVYYTSNAGVDGVVEFGSEEAVYFNLQGVRVDNPERGIYVKVANGKATKVIVK